MKTQTLILKNLIENGEYNRRVLPFIKTEYFEEKHEQIIFQTIADYAGKYNEMPTYETIFIDVSNQNIDEKSFENIEKCIGECKKKVDEPKIDWLIETTERFCKDQALDNALMECVTIRDGKSKTLSKDAMPGILSDALAVSFETNIGHDYLEDAEKRFEYYIKKNKKIPFGIGKLDAVTLGGMEEGTLNMFVAGTHAGKTAMMCNVAAYNLVLGNNVLYITLEMSEEQISKRVDANLLNMTLDELEKMDIKNKSDFMDRINNLKLKTSGKLKTKQFPTGAANVGHIRSHINELQLKQNFFPDLIIVDYLTIMNSVKVRVINGNTNSYTIGKYISEELRGLSVEMRPPVLSAAQFNRGGADSSDPSMNDISESFGMMFTADFACAMLATEELKENGKILFKQLKSRYDDINKHSKFMLNFDRSRMRIEDIDLELASTALSPKKEAKIANNNAKTFEKLKGLKT